jgi:threonine synthase
MDILISSNLERFLYYASNEDEEKTKSLMEALAKDGEYEFKNPYDFFYAYSTDEEKTLEVIKDTYNTYKYLVDPHTAVAYNAYKEYVKETKDNTITVVVSTASPYKFPQVVLEAFGIKEEDAQKAVEMVHDKFDIEIPKVLNYPAVSRKVIKLEDSVQAVRDVVECFQSK